MVWGSRGGHGERMYVWRKEGGKVGEGKVEKERKEGRKERKRRIKRKKWFQNPISG